ncbi:hypothetical protein Taro_026543 [Colocasia esculenta]|uniref:Membrin n=1 Tax=Colocasia esculenta TaxID=4460 RepID=A0A843VFH7_COLES|nr:hypothetical protein [Colocasia esculenta]
MAGGGEGGGAVLSELYKNAQKLLIRTKDGLARLESLDFSFASSSASSSASSAVAISGDPVEASTALRRDIGQIQSLCSEMDRLWRAIPSPGQRGLWKRKLDLMETIKDPGTKELIHVGPLKDPERSMDHLIDLPRVQYQESQDPPLQVVEMTIYIPEDSEQNEYLDNLSRKLHDLEGPLASFRTHENEPPSDHLDSSFTKRLKVHVVGPNHASCHLVLITHACFFSSEAESLVWSRKVEQVAEEADSLRKSLDRQLLRQQNRMQAAKERKDLLERANGESDHVLRIFDEEAQALQSARNSSIMLEEAYATGVAVLSKYSDQRDRLKRAQRKALDVLNTVGLSNSLLKLIERRHRTDKWIAYGGMTAVAVIVFLFWRWTH